MPKIPLMPETKVALLRLLLEGDATAEVLASKLGNHVSVVRRHLETLKSRNLIETRFEKVKRGRPKVVYFLTVEGREIFFARYDLLFDILTETMIKEKGEEKVKKIFSSAAKGLASNLGAPKQMNALHQVLDDIGFQPEERPEGKRELVVSRNCPILRVAKKYPQFTCDTFHTVLLGQMLQTSDVKLKQAMSRGAKECIHEIGIIN